MINEIMVISYALKRIPLVDRLFISITDQHLLLTIDSENEIGNDA